MQWLTHYFGIQRPTKLAVFLRTQWFIELGYVSLASCMTRFHWKRVILSRVLFGAGAAKSMLKAWLKHYHHQDPALLLLQDILHAVSLFQFCEGELRMKFFWKSWNHDIIKFTQKINRVIKNYVENWGYGAKLRVWLLLLVHFLDE